MADRRASSSVHAGSGAAKLPIRLLLSKLSDSKDSGENSLEECEHVAQLQSQPAYLLPGNLLHLVDNYTHRPKRCIWHTKLPEDLHPGVDTTRFNTQTQYMAASRVTNMRIAR